MIAEVPFSGKWMEKGCSKGCTSRQCNKATDRGKMMLVQPISIIPLVVGLDSVGKGGLAIEGESRGGSIYDNVSSEVGGIPREGQRRLGPGEDEEVKQVAAN